MSRGDCDQLELDITSEKKKGDNRGERKGERKRGKKKKPINTKTNHKKEIEIQGKGHINIHTDAGSQRQTNRQTLATNNQTEKNKQRYK